MPCYRNLLVLLHMCMSACTRPFSCGEGPGGEAIVHIAMHIMFHQQKNSDLYILNISDYLCD